MSRAWHVNAPEGRVVLMPRTQPVRRRPVFYAHQSGSNARTVIGANLPYFDFVPNGLHTPLISSDDGGPATWGNDSSVAALDLLFAWPTQVAGIGVLSDKVILYGGSMGCQVNAVWARANPAKVAAIVNVIGIPDVEASRVENRAGVTTALIETAYGNNAGWQTARPTHNPTEFAAQLSGIPILDCYSTNDPHSTVAEHEAFAAAVGPSCVSVSMGAVGHTFFGLDVDRVREFMALYVGGS